MSIKVMSTVWEKSKQKGSALLLLLAIADHAADDGYCWPGIKHLAAKIRMSERSVMRLVKSIEESGELYVIRSNINNRYVVLVGLEEKDLHRILAARKILLPESRGDKLSPDKMTRDTGNARGDIRVTSEVTELCHPNHQDPSLNHQEESFPTDSNFSAREEPPEPATKAKDYLSMCADTYQRTQGKPSWTIPAADDASWANGPVRAFCNLAHIEYESIGSRLCKDWARRIAELAGERTPSEMTAIIPSLVVWEVEDLATPRQERFVSALLEYDLQRVELVTAPPLVISDTLAAQLRGAT